MLITSSTPSIESPSALDAEGQFAHLPGNGQILREIHRHLGPASSAILLTFEAVFDLPESRIGLLTICSELLADIRARGKSAMSPEVEAWHTAIDQLRRDIRTITGLSDAHDRSTATSLRLPLASLLLNYPSTSLNPRQEQSLRNLRADLCLWHLNTKRKLPKDVATSFVRLLKSRPDAHNQAILSAIPTTAKDIEPLRSTFDPASKTYSFLSHLYLALSESIRLPPLAPTPAIRVLSKSAIESTTQTNQTPETIAPKRPKQINTSQDLIAANLSRIAFARPKDLSGVTGLPDKAQPAELIEAFHALTEELHGPKCTTALAAMMAALCNARPRQFGLIPLWRAPEHAIWLDLEAGHICWILEAVTAQKRYLDIKKMKISGVLTVVRNPLPRALVIELCRLFAGSPRATTLADIFPIQPEQLDKDVKRLLRKLSKTSHHLTVEGLRAGYGTFLLGLTQDEALSSAMSMNFCLGTPANLNYWPLRANRISQVASQAYAILGLPDGLWSSPAFDTGSAQLNCEPKLRELVSRHLLDAMDAFQRIHLKSSPSDLIRAHNVIATSIFALTLVTTGHRKTREAFARHTLDLELALAILGDKRTSPYHFARVVALPTITVDWLKFYFDWLALLRYRLHRTHRELAALCDSLIATHGRRALGPLFFVIDRRHRPKPIGTKSLRKAFAGCGQPENAGRHWVCLTLVDAGYDSATVMAQAGRGAGGQESFGVRSAMDPITVSRTVRQVLDNAMSKWQLPSAHRISARPLLSTFDRQSEHIPYAFREGPILEPIDSQFVEHCPFGEFTLANSAKFVALRKLWLETAPSVNLGSLAASLVFLDGVVEINELTAAVRGLLANPIYHHGTDFFLDTETRQHGIRRIWLHPATLVIAAKAFETLGTPPESERWITAKIEEELRTILRATPCAVMAASPLLYLTNLAREYITLRAPGVLRAWWLGDLAARTLRPECTARHRTNNIEHPKPSVKSRRQRPRDSEAQFIHDAIKEAINNKENRGSNPLRMKKLKEDLVPYVGQALGAPYIELLLSYVIFLTDRVDAPSSIPRYMTPISDLIRQLADHIDSADSIQEAPWQEAVGDYVHKFSASNTSDHTAEISALNHLLDCFGIDRQAVQPIDKAAPARRYADQPSHLELARAIDLVPSLTPASRSPLVPGTLLSVAGDLPVRWGEISRTRTVDFDLGCQPHCVITHAAIGRQKSSNAYRIIQLSSPEAIERVAHLIQLRTEQFPLSREVFLAAAADNPCRIDETNGGAEIIHEALRLATGSSELRPHDLRGYYISRAMNRALHPHSRQGLSPLELRQTPYRLQVEAGHGDLTTTVVNYVTGFDELRHAWMNEWLSNADAILSPIFISSLSGIPADTLRTRSRRQGKPVEHDPMENFDLSEYPGFGARIRKLADMVVPDCRVLTNEATDNVQPGFSDRNLYVGLRLVGQSIEAASLESGIREHDQDVVEQTINNLQVRTGKTWLEPCKFTAQRLRSDPLFKNLNNALGGWHPLPIEQFILQRAFGHRPDQPWTFETVEDVKALTNLWMHIASAGLTVSSAHDESNPKVIEHRLVAQGAGITTAKTLAHRNFRHAEQVKVSFFPKGIPDNAIPRTVGWASFLVSVITAASFL